MRVQWIHVLFMFRKMKWKRQDIRRGKLSAFIPCEMVTPLSDTNWSNKADSIINQEVQQQGYASLKSQTNRYAYNQNHSDCAEFCQSVNDKTLPEE